MEEEELVDRHAFGVFKLLYNPSDKMKGNKTGGAPKTGEVNATRNLFPFRFTTDNKLTILIILWLFDKLVMFVLFWAFN